MFHHTNAIDIFCLGRTGLVVKWSGHFSIDEFSGNSQIKRFLLQCSELA